MKESQIFHNILNHATLNRNARFFKLQSLNVLKKQNKTEGWK